MTYELDDGQTLRSTVDEALIVANAALTNQKEFILRQTWKPKTRSSGVQEVPVYLLRRRLPVEEVIRGVANTRAAVASFRSGIDKAKIDPRYKDCSDSEACVSRLYTDTRISQLASDVYGDFAAVDSAVTESDCKCVILMEDDLDRFKLIIGPSITSGLPMVPVTWYIPWYTIHEVGHRNKDFHLKLNPIWAGLYKRALIGLNNLQLEEMRADAYAATVVGNACFHSSQAVHNIVVQACSGLEIQALQLWFYALFDKTDIGLKRQYLEDSNTHPNMLMRLLAMILVMTDGSQNSTRLLSDFLNKREALSIRFTQQAIHN